MIRTLPERASVSVVESSLPSNVTLPEYRRERANGKARRPLLGTFLRSSAKSGRSNCERKAGS